MSSRYGLFSLAACSPASRAACASGLNFGYGGPNINELKPALKSTVQVPVRLKGGFGRGFARLSGARAPSGKFGGAACGCAPFVGGCADCCACAPDATAPIIKPNTTVAAKTFLDSLISAPFHPSRLNRLRQPPLQLPPKNT